MAQFSYRANLESKAFPLLAENFGQTVIVRQYDQNSSQDPEQPGKSSGIPQFYYAHNVMPHSEGLQSVGYVTLLSSALSLFSRIILLREDKGYRAYLGITSTGDFYISTGGAWVYKATYVGQVTTAYVNGLTYIYIEGVGCRVYNFISLVFDTYVLTGITIVGAGAAVGICPAAGYLIVWNATTVFWSSTIDPTDFVPSLITGAGSLSVEGAKGALNYCVQHTLGFIVYTESNAVAALYSGNSRYPFNFREIVSSGGLSSLSLVAFDANTGNHYAYTTSGLQIISSSQSQTIFPDITDFISGELFEDFDTVSNTLVRTVLATTMQKQIAVVASRYLIISYGVSSLTHAIVYDLITKRYGKLKKDHVAIFEYQLPISVITEIPRQSIGLLQANGTILRVDFDITNLTSDAVLLLGKYQFVRSRMLQLDTIELENIEPTSNFSILLQTSLDGKNYTTSTPVSIYTNGTFRSYGSSQVGRNHTLVLKGSFHLNSLELAFHVHGKIGVT